MFNLFFYIFSFSFPIFFFSFTFLLLFLSFSVVLFFLTIFFIFSFVFDFNGLVSMFFSSLNSFTTLQNVLLIHVKHTSMPYQRHEAYKTAYFIKENLIKSLMSQPTKFECWRARCEQVKYVLQTML